MLFICLDILWRYLKLWRLLLSIYHYNSEQLYSFYRRCSPSCIHLSFLPFLLSIATYLFASPFRRFSQRPLE